MTSGRAGDSAGTMVHGVNAPGRARIAAKTLRTDRWWLPQLITGAVLALFAVYATFRAFQNATTTPSRTSRRSTRRA